MLNKIKIVGKVLPIDIKERDKEEREKNERIFYFSLLVPNPSGSLTILRCIVQGEKAEEIEKEIREDEILEIKGYLRNEKSGRQVLVKVIDFAKLDIISDKIDITQSNQVRLLGKIVTDFKNRQNEGDSDVLSFRIAVPREGNMSPLFFCRVQGELISEVSSKLKKGDIILLEGFLQTKKITETGGEGEEMERKFSRISSIICQAFTLIDNDSAAVFNPLELVRVEGKVEKIDFTKPKEKGRWDEKITE
jgi:single-stranded DNA-binding protein